MSRFQLWDIPSASLLAETDDVGEIVLTVQSFIDDVGLDGLNDFNLTDATLSDSPADNSSGEEIMTVLQGYLANELASSTVRS